MTVSMHTFLEKNSKLKIESHPSDINFLIVRNCNQLEGQKLCKKYSASGLICGKESQDFMIGNFGRYN